MVTDRKSEPITIGPTALRTLPLGVGVLTWGRPTFMRRFHLARIAYGPSDGPEQEKAAYEASLAAGVTFFDTAAVYSFGASEERLGELSRGKDVFIATKFPSRYTHPHTEDFPECLRQSLRRLQRSTIDLYQVHFQSSTLSIPRVMEYMADAVQEGKIRAVGVSNYTERQMRWSHELLAKRGIPLASHQVNYSLLHREPEVNGVFNACRELGVTLIAYMPLAMGALTGKYTGDIRTAGLRRLMTLFRGKRLQDVARVVDLLRTIGEAHEKRPAQVALRWLIQQGSVLPIPGAKNGQQAAENAGALTFVLSDSEIEGLNEATLPWRSGVY